MLDEAGLTPGVDLQVVNMGFADLSDALRTGQIDAVFVWDPWIENFVRNGIAKVVAQDTSLTMVIAMRDDFIEEHPDEVQQFLKAHKEATLFVAQNQEMANAWFREPAAAQTLPVETIQTATAFDPQWEAEALSDIRLSFNEAERERYMGLGQRASDLKLFPSLPPLEEKTDMSAAAEIDGESWEFDPTSVRVTE